MSTTQACCERHRQRAREHEESARAWLEDTSALLRRRRREPTVAWTAGGGADGGAATPAAGSAGQAAAGQAGGGPVGDPADKAVRCALSQQRLAVREYREAHRLRPRDSEILKRLAAAQRALGSLQAALEDPQQPKPLRRFLAHHNLSLRYWDLGKAKEAVAEARRALRELQSAGLAGGCAEHNLALMQQVHAEFRAEERRLLEAARRAPEAVGPSYELGVLYFDKRMLHRADAQLKAARDLARRASALRLVEHDRQKQMQAQSFSSSIAAAAAAPAWLSLEDKKNQRLTELLGDIDDDLVFLAGLRQHWCAEEEMGKAEELQETGVRDGARPHLLPCLRRRFAQDCSACDQWWSELCK